MISDYVCTLSSTIMYSFINYNKQYIKQEVVIMAVSKHTRKSSGGQWIKRRNIAKSTRKRLEREQIKRDRLRKIRKRR